jgi:hypothetical protein
MLGRRHRAGHISAGYRNDMAKRASGSSRPALLPFVQTRRAVGALRGARLASEAGTLSDQAPWNLGRILVAL